MQEILQLAAYVLAHDAHQLPAQMISHLNDHHDAAVRALVAQTRRFNASPWLCPVTRTSLYRPGRPLKCVFPHPDPAYMVVVTPDGRNLVSGDGYGCVRVWDRAAGQQVAELDTGYPVFACTSMLLAYIVCEDEAGAMWMLELKGQQ